MILTDAGPLIALLDARDEQHVTCVEAITDLTGPMVTSWPAFTEAMYLLASRNGWQAQEQLWRLVMRKDLVLVDCTETMIKRVHELMKKYRDVPMDLADATLVVIAEKKKLKRIFTLDDDFQVYRLSGRQTFDVVPELD